MPPKKIYPCISCKEHIKTGTASIQCACCELWIHKTCSKISEAMFKLICDIKEMGEQQIWTCTSCGAAMKTLNSKIVQLQARVKAVEDDVRVNKEDVAKVTDKVEKMEQDVNSLKNSDRSSGNTKDEILREMAERDAKKDNIVIHNLLEPDHTVTDGESRKKLDQSSLSDVLRTINININFDKEVKFVKRAGERTDKSAPRPLLVGFRENKTKEDVMKSANLLANSKYKHISIVPDLTKNQRKLETDMRKEAEKLTAEMDPEEAKNWEYRLVGIKGRREIRKVHRRKDTTYQTTNSRKRPSERNSYQTVDQRSRQTRDRNRVQTRKETQEDRDSDDMDVRVPGEDVQQMARMMGPPVEEEEEEEIQDQPRRSSTESPPGKQARH